LQAWRGGKFAKAIQNDKTRFKDRVTAHMTGKAAEQPFRARQITYTDWLVDSIAWAKFETERLVKGGRDSRPNAVTAAGRSGIRMRQRSHSTGHGILFSRRCEQKKGDGPYEIFRFKPSWIAGIAS
jgi:hypothetical protein